MSKFNDLKKTKFINNASVYSEGKIAPVTSRVTFSMSQKYIDILNNLSKKDRLSKSQIIRAALLNISKLSMDEKEPFYDATFLEDK